MLGIINTNDLNKDLIGAKAKVVLRPKDKREGTIKDIFHYEEI